MKRELAALAFLFMVLPLVSHARAATLKVIATKDGKVIVSLSGDISEGDTDAVKAAIKTANDAGKLVSGIRLNSTGGNLLEGVKLADAVRFAKVATNVAQGATCASACFLVFAAGETKFANYSARVGVHGASDQSGAETVQSNAATVSMARVAKELGVPAAIIGRMVVTPPSEMVWLSPADLQSMGATMVGKPSQVATDNPPSVLPPRQTPTGGPIDLSPTTRATAPATTSWSNLVDKVISLSSAQHGGSPKIARSCQPRSKICNTGIAFKYNGVDSMVLSREDLSGKTIQRELCTFNSFGDVRTCIDWDTDVKHRDMKDGDGNWYKVADE